MSLRGSLDPSEPLFPFSATIFLGSNSADPENIPQHCQLAVKRASSRLEDEDGMSKAQFPSLVHRMSLMAT